MVGDGGTNVTGVRVADRLHVGVAYRLSRYLQVLTQAQKMGKERNSSQEISDYTNINATQIRRDLSGFGKFGKRGVGYSVDSLVGGSARSCARKASTTSLSSARAGWARRSPAPRSSPSTGQHRRRVRPRPGQDRPANRAECGSVLDANASQGGARQEHHRRRPRRSGRRARRTRPTSWSPPACGSSSTTRKRCSTSRTTCRCTRRTPRSSC